MARIKWPVALATLFVLLLGWYVVYTQQIVRALRADAETLTRIFVEVQRGIASTEPGAEMEALFRLQRAIIESEVPIVQTGPGDTVYAAQNLPFEVDMETREGQERVRAYVRRLDLRHPPVSAPEQAYLHFGDTPEVLRLRWIPWLQVAGLLLTVVVGFTMIRYQRRVEGERAWTAMARELAHQLGTPISSLQGWLELLRLPPEELPDQLGEGEIAAGVEEDLVRLERISHRFELIGRGNRPGKSLPAVRGERPGALPAEPHAALRFRRGAPGGPAGGTTAGQGQRGAAHVGAGERGE